MATAAWCNACTPSPKRTKVRAGSSSGARKAVRSLSWQQPIYPSIHVHLWYRVLRHPWKASKHTKRCPLGNPAWTLREPTHAA